MHLELYVSTKKQNTQKTVHIFKASRRQAIIWTNDGPAWWRIYVSLGLDVFKLVSPMTPYWGPLLNIKTVLPRYGDSHVKDETVLYLSRGSIYCWDDIFILRNPRTKFDTNMPLYHVGNSGGRNLHRILIRFLISNWDPSIVYTLLCLYGCLYNTYRPEFLRTSLDRRAY